MNKLNLGTRLLLGLIFFVFGLNGFLNFLPPQPELPQAGGQFIGALIQTGYMFPLIKGIEVIAGLLLLSGFFVPLALLLLAPIVVNIALFHFILAPAPVLPLVIIALMLAQAYAHRDVFSQILKAK